LHSLERQVDLPPVAGDGQADVRGLSLAAVEHYFQVVVESGIEEGEKWGVDPVVDVAGRHFEGLSGRGVVEVGREWPQERQGR